MIDAAAARRLEACLRAGGVAVFGADTVYGLACAAGDPAAAERLYAIKERPADKPAAVMFMSLRAALGALPELGPRTRAVARRLLPGPVTLLVENPRERYPVACGPDPRTLGLRVPAPVPSARALEGVGVAILQSSANLSGGPEAARLEDVDARVRARADLCLDAGRLPGTASTVLDLRGYESAGAWRVLREGAVTRDALERAVL